MCGGGAGGGGCLSPRWRGIRRGRWRPAGGVVPALPGLLAGAGTGAIPTDVPPVTVICVVPLTVACDPAVPLVVTRLAVIVTVPGPTNVTSPVWTPIVATFVLLVLHVTCVVTSCVVPSAYIAVAVSRRVCPTLTPPPPPGVPAIVTWITAPCVFVREYDAGVPSGPVVRFAVTLYVPTVVMAVNTGAVAMPLAFVVAVAVRTPPVKVPEGPEAGAVKVTEMPPTGLLPASVTFACRLVAKAVFPTAFCPPPAAATMLVGTLAMFVSANVAGAETPGRMPPPCTRPRRCLP